MTTKIYIGNLSFQTTKEQVRRLCAPFGDVKSVDMIVDRNTGRFRGFCFVEMEQKAAAAAIAALNGKKESGRQIRVSKARSQKQRQPRQKRKADAKEIPLHERTQRGGYGADDGFPHTGRGRRSGEYRSRGDDDGDFPDSGGNVRGNL